MFLALFLASCALQTPQSQQTADLWWRNAAGPAYQVLVYSFADADGDGFGDLRGLIEHLDYLNDGNPDGGADLGVSAIWLSPVHPASSYHGYDVKDYKAIDPRLGSMEDFEQLVQEAHRRGIKIILDMVFNHTSREHPWFLDAMRSAASPYVSYYRTRQPGLSYGSGGMGRFYRYTRPDGSVFEYFSAFWEGMPDLNLDNTDVVNELKGILAFWLEKGVDGFRFDAAKHAFDPNEMPAGTSTLALNRAFWTDLRRSARRVKPDVMFIGEVLTESVAEITAYAPVFDGLFDFPAARLATDTARLLGAGRFLDAYLANYKQYQRTPAFTPLPLLSNHDQDRIMSILLTSQGLDGARGVGPDSQDTPSVTAARALVLQKARLAASLYQTLPGLPFIYYGEELGMTGRRYRNDDVARRDAFPWSDTTTPPFSGWTKTSDRIEPGQNSLTIPLDRQMGDPDSLFAHYQRLALMRAALPAIRQGTFVPLAWQDSLPGNVLGWSLVGGGQNLLVMHNLNAVPQSITLPQGLEVKEVWHAARGLLTEGRAFRGGEAFSLEAFQSAVFEIR